MAQLRALLVAAVLLAGCQTNSTPGPTDPFFGRTRIEPPRTGAVSTHGRGAYTAAEPQDTAIPATTPAPNAVAATETSQTAADGQSGDRIAIPASARETAKPQPATSVASVASDPQSTGASESTLDTRLADSRSSAASPARERIYQTIAPRPRDATARSSGLGTSPSGASGTSPASSGQPIDIMDLPPVASGAKNSASDTGIRLVSHVEEPKAPAGSTASSQNGGGASSYGYDPQYGWLRGRLEYSDSRRQWKLRYIPIDGVTDSFGGSVVLANAEALSGFERGNFVEVQGKLKTAEAGKQSFSPDYEVQTIKLVRK